MPVTFAAPRNQCACGVSAGTHALTVFNQCAGDVSPDPAADAPVKAHGHSQNFKQTVFNQCAFGVSPNHAAHAQRECGEDGFRLFAHAAPVKLVPEAHALTVFKQRARAEPAILAPRKNAADAPVKAHGH